ncbi:MAG: aryl-sulfate sulfotransferase, partial [Halobaculum sp.]
MIDSLPALSRKRVARLLAFLLVVGLFAPAGVAAVSPQSSGTPGQVGLEKGTVTSPASNTTIVSIQGFHFRGKGAQKKPARLVAVEPNGTTKWVFDGRQYGARWFYDVDPLPNGNLLVVSTNAGGTLVYELNPETKEQVWEEEFDFHDTHDVDMLPNGNLLIANMRNWNNETKVSNDRILVYNRTTDETVWEWKLRNHYPNSTDGGFNKDWSHVNDIDRIGPGRYLVSPRNFDQAIVVNRSTGKITERLGTDGAHEILNEQHNPDWLVSEDGDPAVLVADSEND